jgi:hypothetical protein
MYSYLDMPDAITRTRISELQRVASLLIEYLISLSFRIFEEFHVFNRLKSHEIVQFFKLYCVVYKLHGKIDQNTDKVYKGIERA